MLRPVSPDSAAGTLDSARLGDMTYLGALGGEPVLIVDLDAGSPSGAPGRPALDVDVTFPGVVIATSRTATDHSAARAVDVALTTVPSAPAPWVSIADLDAARQALVANVVAAPLAATTLVHVLRSSSAHPVFTRSVATDLTLESLAYSTLLAGPELGRWLASRPAGAPGRDRADPVVARRNGDSLTITLNRPHVHNAFSAALRDALFEMLSLAATDTSIGEVHLRGEGPSFCSGGDLDEFGTRPDPATAHLIRTARSCAMLLARVADRTTAHLHGSCIGAGIELAALAHHVTAAPDTTVRLPEVAMGLIPGAGGTASLPRRIGRQRTAWLALSGEAIGVATAMGWGLVDTIEP